MRNCYFYWKILSGKGGDVPLPRGRFLKSRNHIQRKAAQRHHGYQLLRNVCHKALEMQWVKCHNLPPQPWQGVKNPLRGMVPTRNPSAYIRHASVVKMAKKWFDACISLSFRLTDLTCFGNWLRKQMHQFGLLPNTVQKRGHFAIQLQFHLHGLQFKEKLWFSCTL